MCIINVRVVLTFDWWSNPWFVRVRVYQRFKMCGGGCCCCCELSVIVVIVQVGVTRTIVPFYISPLCCRHREVSITIFGADRKGVVRDGLSGMGINGAKER